MSLFGSLFSGVSGLNAQGRAMGMISDNVANVNTTAYRSAVAQFSSLVTRSGGSLTYSPGGVRALSAYTSNQGLIQSSASPTDAAIAGGGFFVVNTDGDDPGEQLYTRAGSFSPDFLGNLRTPSGAYLQGWVLDADEQVIDINNLETVNVRVINGLAASTTSVRIGANLNADREPHLDPYAAGDMALYEATGGTAGVQPHFTRDLQVYDSLGRSHNVTVSFLRQDPTVEVNSWHVELFARPDEVNAGTHPNGLLASGTVSFNGDGSLNQIDLVPIEPGGAVAGEPITIDWADIDGAENSVIRFEFGTPGETNALTQFSSPSNVAFVNQNGAPVGELNGVRIDENGYVLASFTNGQERRIFKLPIATFPNPGGLEPRSGNLFSQTDASGEFNLSEAGQGGAGLLTPSALEASNIDLADEFTKMIVTQRAYSASARIITSTDEMLDELMRLKR
jgi:flagellar hook protein FlgE